LRFSQIKSAIYDDYLYFEKLKSDMPMKEGMVYLLRDIDLLSGNASQYLKIGKTEMGVGTPKRIKQHQTGNPRKIYNVFDIQAPGMTEMELFMQHYFSSLRISGEWFDIDDILLNSEVLPLMNTHFAEQTITNAHIANVEQSKAMPDNGVARAPSAQEQTWSDELKSAKEALRVAKAYHSIRDFNLRSLIGTNGGIEGIVTLIEKTQADYFDKAAFLQTLTPGQLALCQQDETKFTQKVGWMNKPQSLKNLDLQLFNDAKEAKDKAPDSIPIANLANAELARNAAIEAEHREWLATRRDIKVQEWIVTQKEMALLDSLGVNREITDVVSWVREDVTTLEKWNIGLAKENFPNEIAALTTSKPNHVAVEINECRGYP
jgi:hypothetical protein|tara:strand:+ start:34 stop:1161 length:1128 start_codon:yes stop_codon:yes gene_type:complete